MALVVEDGRVGRGAGRGAQARLLVRLGQGSGVGSGALAPKISHAYASTHLVRARHALPPGVHTPDSTTVECALSSPPHL